MRKYRPSNGTEGISFCESFCDQCVHEKFQHTHNDGDKMCDIMSRAFLHDINDPEYPVEWVYDVNDKPTCTAWSKWDWGRDDDGNWNEPPEPEPEDPNQLMLFSEWDEIEFQDNPVEKSQSVLP